LKVVLVVAEEVDVVPRVSSTKAWVLQILLVLLLEVRLLMYWVVGKMCEGVGEVGAREPGHRWRHRVCLRIAIANALDSGQQEGLVFCCTRSFGWWRET
jgi:hypothetical protein